MRYARGLHALRPTLPLVLLLLAPVFLASPAPAATVRVPQDQPTLKAAVAAARSGDVILLAPGTHAGGVLIEGKSLIFTSLFRETGDTSYVSRTIVSGITSYCSGSAPCRGDAVFEFGSNAHGSAVVGLTVRDGAKGVRAASRVDIEHCYVVKTSDGTNYTSGSRGTIRNNLFANNSDDGIDLNSETIVRVIDNIIRNNGDDGIEFRLYPYDDSLATIEFIGNTITGNVQDGIQFIDYPDSSHRLLRVERNVIADNKRAGVGFLADGNTVQDFSGPPVPERLDLLHNTFVGNGYGVVGGANVVSVGNLFVGSTGAGLRRVRGRSIAAHDLFWGNTVDWEESNVDFARTLRADPLLTPARTLGPGSPAIDAGVASFVWQGRTVLDLPPSAYSGSAPDLGAFETSGAPPGPALSIEDLSVPEGRSGPSTAEIVVRLSHPVDAEVRVRFATVDGSAIAGSDYVAASGTLAFPPLATSRTIAVTVLGDAVPEGDETFEVVLTDPEGASVARARGRCTIASDDLPSVFEARVAASADDAEESPTGSVSVSSSDLEMMLDGTLAQKATGVRFAAVAIPPGATIASAWIQFRAKDARSEATSLAVRAHAVDHAPAFAGVSGDLTRRATTAAQALWPNVPAWSSGQSGAVQRTPDLSRVIQEIVDRPGWRSGNAIAFLVTGSGRRVADAFDVGAAGAAALHVEYFVGNRAPRVEAGPDTAVTTSGAALLHGAVADDGLPSPAALAIRWSASGPGPVVFDDPASAATRATFAVAGAYRLELRASDGELEARDSMTVSVTDASRIPVSLDARVASGADDAEETSAGVVSLSSTDLEMMLDGGIVQRAVGVRFAALAIPPEARITAAWIQFKSKYSRSASTSLEVRAHAADHAPAFAFATRNVSGRPLTSAAAAWSGVAPWTTGQSGAPQRTPDLSGVLQEVVSRPGWRSGNAVAFVITGGGDRPAYAFDSGIANAPALHVEYVLAPANQPPRVEAGPDTTVLVTGAAFLRGSVLDDGLPSPPSLSARWSLGRGPGAVAFDDERAPATRARFTVAGDYRLDLVASDGALEARDSVRVRVLPPPNRAPVADLVVNIPEAVAPHSILADATGSADPDGDALVYRFDFGDGAVLGPQESPVATHLYGAGDWRVSVIVTDVHGAADTASRPVLVHANLVRNPSFESALTGWNANGARAVVARVAGGYDGLYSVEARGDSTLGTFGVNDAPNWVSPAAAPGARYRFSAWVRSERSTGRAHLKVREYLNGVLQGTAILSPMIDLAPVWQPLTVDAVAAAPGSTLDFQILDKPRTPFETFQADHVSIHRVPEIAVEAASVDAPSGTGAEAIAFGARIHPNPLRGRATLELAITRPGAARVVLLDLQGRIVRTLIDSAWLPAGRHRMVIEARGSQALRPGLYLYRVEAAEGRRSGKIAILD